MDRPTLVEDVVAVIDAVFTQVLGFPSGTETSTASFYLVGHSLGGAIAAAVASDARMKTRTAGLVMVDIVEETAIFGLRHMPAFLEKRPLSFASPAEAAEWYVAEGGVRNLAGIQGSVERSLKRTEDGRWTWRADLGATAPFWEGWFTGMNANFLGNPNPKVLLLAGTDRLDKGLTTAHMQGKFQLEVVRDAGHHVQEDQPNAVAEKIAKFVVRVDKLTRQLARR